MPAPKRPPALILPLAHNQHRRLEPDRIDDLLYLAGHLDQGLRWAGRYGADPATRLQIERWRDEDGCDLTMLAQRLSNDALLRAEDEWEAEQDHDALAREDAADRRMRQEREEMAGV